MKRKLLSIIATIIVVFSHAQQKINFTEKFKKEHQGKYKIEINEVKELILIMTAITQFGLQNEDMVEQNTAYYKEVLAHFKPFENEDIIKTFDSLLVKSAYNYIFLSGNAISYDFKGDQLKPSPTFIFPATSLAGIKITENPITKYKQKIEDFAKKTKFRQFYKDHKNYYTSLSSDYNKLANLGQQWQWLEKKFDSKINSYTIYCSPLINGLNYTDDFKNNNFTLAYMVLPPIIKDSKMSEKELEIYNTRIMFTEIDHNYVEQPSHNNAAIIDKKFADKKQWLDENIEGVYAYPTPTKVFNEYMTYGAFILYSKDFYDAKTFENTKNGVIQVMKERGFIKMQEFTDKLLLSYAINHDKKIDEWYPEFLNQF